MIFRSQEPKRNKNARTASLKLESLETRQVLSSSFQATWVGQAGVDDVGPWNDLRPSGIQDVEIDLSGLAQNRTITHAIVQGYGGDRWDFQGPAGSWLAEIQRSPGSSSAKLFFEPARQETGREFSVTLTWDDGTTEGVSFPGGTADPNLHMPGQGVAATWIGSTAGVDLTQPSAAIGPDGMTDLQIGLSQLSTRKTIKAIDLVDGSNNWVASYGLNPSRVGSLEFSRNPINPDMGTLTFSVPNRAMTGPMTVQVSYTDGSKETTSCPIGPVSSSPVSLPPATTFTYSNAAAQWLGQTPNDTTRPGWERIAVTNMPARGIVAWQLNDPAGQTFLWTVSGQGSPWAAAPETKSLVATQDTSGNWTLDFDSRLDTSGRPLNLLAQTVSGQTVSIDLTGGSVDISKRTPAPAATETFAGPGANLQDLVNKFGTVHLADGVYALSQPLVLQKPINLVGSAGAILQFSQAAADPAWTAAIKLASGNIQLSGFQVRFGSPVRWQDNISYGPAVIGSPDNYDFALGRIGAMPNVVIQNLNIQGPQQTAINEEAPRLVRMTGDVSGRIQGNTLYGGMVEVLGGPWSITSNTHTGTCPGSIVYDAFAAHEIQGLTLTGNVVAPGPNSGAVFRLVSINGRSSNVSITNNQAIGLGSKFGDSPYVQGINANEVILTENYRVQYEGSLLGVDSTRRLVRVPAALSESYQPGDRVAILRGGQAGTAFTIQAVINSTTLLLDQALPADVTTGTAISINRGISGLTISNNVIDQTDRPQSLGIVAVGNIYGLTLANNTIKGGLRGFQVMASPSESSMQWGWSRNVVQNAVISGNTLVDVLWFNQVTVSHDTSARANYERLYLSANITGNTFRWSDSFLRQQIGQSPTDSNLLLPGMQLGENGIWDIQESRLTVAGNLIDLPTGWLNRPAQWNQNGMINGQVADGSLVVLQPVKTIEAPTGLGLVTDTGSSASDGLTNQAKLRLNTLPGLSYEYQTNRSSAWLPVANPAGFVPAGLTDGLVSVNVRAFDISGARGPAATFSFTLDTTAPAAPTGLARTTLEGVAWQKSASADAISQTVTLTNGSFTETQTLAPNVVATTLNQWATGSNSVAVSAVDAAGNRSAPASISLSYLSSGTWGGQDGTDFASLATSLKPDGKQDVRLDIQGLPYGKSVTAIVISGFGGGQWAWPVATAGSFAAAWKPATGGHAGAFYFQPNRTEIGRPFNVTISFSDGTSANFWVQGGKASPNLPVKVVALAANNGSGGTITGASTTTKKTVAVTVKTPAVKVVRTASPPRVPARRLKSS